MAPPTRRQPATHSTINPLPRFFAKHFADGVVIQAETLGCWRAVRIHCPAMHRLNYAPGQHVRIEIRDPFSLYGILRPVETMRTYTIWDWDRQALAFELRAHLYRSDGDGIGLNWMREVRGGDRVRFWGPQGNFLVGSAPRHLFVGDETASVAFGPMLRAVGADEESIAIVEAENPDAMLPLTVTNGELRRVYRLGASPVASTRLLEAVANAGVAAHNTLAYVAGEAKTCQIVRRHLIAEGWEPTRIQVKPFWAPGKRGLH
ncbi:siderophore-interacting protein [Alkalimonas sp. NCh-2]|uniref:siderophore-interacting protein n=1 Tax=Alkalimonas sp. NCh-2 TaxID=3144846 RepID=UPI0031F6B847